MLSTHNTAGKLKLFMQTFTHDLQLYLLGQFLLFIYFSNLIIL